MRINGRSENAGYSPRRGKHARGRLACAGAAWRASSTATRLEIDTHSDRLGLGQAAGMQPTGKRVGTGQEEAIGCGVVTRRTSTTELRRRAGGCRHEGRSGRRHVEPAARCGQGDLQQASSRRRGARTPPSIGVGFRDPKAATPRPDFERSSRTSAAAHHLGRPSSPHPDITDGDTLKLVHMYN